MRVRFYLNPSTSIMEVYSTLQFATFSTPNGAAFTSYHGMMVGRVGATIFAEVYTEFSNLRERFLMLEELGLKVMYVTGMISCFDEIELPFGLYVYKYAHGQVLPAGEHPLERIGTRRLEMTAFSVESLLVFFRQLSAASLSPIAFE